MGDRPPPATVDQRMSLLFVFVALFAFAATTSRTSHQGGPDADEDQ
jgi:hypothetical protein